MPSTTLDNTSTRTEKEVRDYFSGNPEVPDQDAFLKQVHALLKPGGKFLLVEPIIHVPERAFQATVARVLAAGLKQVQPVPVNLSRAILFSRS